MPFELLRKEPGLLANGVADVEFAVAPGDEWLKQRGVLGFDPESGRMTLSTVTGKKGGVIDRFEGTIYPDEGKNMVRLPAGTEVHYQDGVRLRTSEVKVRT